MTNLSLPLRTPVIVQPRQLQPLFDALKARGYRLIGPRLGEGAIVYDELADAAQLPVGWTDMQDAGKYRLVRRNDAALFGYSTVPSSWKRYLNPPTQRIWQAQLKDGAFKAFEIIDEPIVADRIALIGVRPCDLRAIAALDRVLMGGEHVDPGYRARRENTFIVAVNCSQAGGSCFCTSMGTGPKAESGYDLVLTEVLEDDRHFLLVRSGTEAGAAVLEEVPHLVAGPADLMAAVSGAGRVTAEIRRHVNTEGLKELLNNSYDHPVWEQVAQKCLACGNCTLVCPTCFCSTVEDVTDLTGTRAERWRRWDSCFNVEFSYIHGGAIRTSVMSRYRQRVMHKLSAWHDQFGSSGCVGCGRCITWCPAGIDITGNARDIQEGVSA